MFSAIFIDRPRFAIVIAIVITLAGAIAITSIPIAQFPDIVPPQVTLTANYPGADAEVVDDHRGATDRGADQRRRQRDLLPVRQRLRRQLYVERDLRAGHRSGHRYRQRAEPLEPRHAAASRRGVARRYLGPQEIRSPASSHQYLFAEKHLRRRLFEQLRDHQCHRHAGADQGRRPGHLVRAARLFAADLARSRSADRAQSDAERRHYRRAEPERSGGTRPHWRRADCKPAAASDQHQDQGQADAARGVRRHHSARQSRWLGDSGRRRGARRNGRAIARSLQPLQRRTRRRDRHLPVARLQRSRCGEASARHHEYAGDALPRRSHL